MGLSRVGRSRIASTWRFVRSLGPGLVAGASDNDPTSVATIAIVASTTVYGLSWLMVLVLPPMLITVQYVSSRVGAVAGSGLETLIRHRFGPWWAIVAMAQVVVVNIVTLGADLEGGAAALSLLTGVEWRWFVVPLTLVLGGLVLLGSYDEVERFLRYVLLVFAAYVVAAFLARPDWSDVLRHTFLPSFELNYAYVAGSLALLGSTLTSYVYFWQTIEETEERPPRDHLLLVETDAVLGAALASMIFWFILVTTGATLGTKGVQVQTAADAASALAPLAGPYAEILFAVGLLASAVMVVPVLAATTAYVFAEGFGWRGSLNDPVSRSSWQFYATLIGSMVVGLAFTLLGIAPLQLLFLASIVGGLGTPAVLALLMLVATDTQLMSGLSLPRGAIVAGWLTTIVMGGASVAYVVMQVLPG